MCTKCFGAKLHFVTLPTWNDGRLPVTIREAPPLMQVDAA
jgi:hypothetical protein